MNLQEEREAKAQEIVGTWMPNGQEGNQGLMMEDVCNALLSHEEKVVARVAERQIAEAVDLTKREIKHRVENYFKNAYLSLKQQGGVYIHLEEIQEIIDDSTPPGFALTLPITEEK